MNHPEPAVVFDEKRAAAYDERFAKLSPIRDALHLMTRGILSELSADARILCVGAGTGLELLDLAQAFPGWTFVAVEPAAPMLTICRRRAEEHGIASRCTFHEGYLDSLAPTEPFDAATSLLVSHFLLDQDRRVGFFREIAARLRPGGLLVSADFACDMSTSEYRSLLEVWLRLMHTTDTPAEEVENFRRVYGRDVAFLPPAVVESIIERGGFEAPVAFYQALLIRAWSARRSV